ncbi:hypothetical protein LSO07_13460 [Janthinobacterium sp. PLB04]|uniref:Uncharacterized protein n=1 Tax=Janthinobacterium lividum TaxID=29581 RepID=A0AAJ4T7N2_9BURK|nr:MULTISPECIES: hypothetical protein [Janthinobacterium]KAB0324730.1 hypothetical protein F3B38_13510 [Janthinobacterium lividum]QSX98840.1 hypothetical protein J3P46_13610 [Janthinobacterium lividum]UGQ38815.1 hypothetical protein LSO07_13460 [Janthinobacterium sp. PLB04]
MVSSGTVVAGSGWVSYQTSSEDAAFVLCAIELDHAAHEKMAAQLILLCGHLVLACGSLGRG